MTFTVATVPFHLLSESKRPLLLLLLAFIFTFGMVRLYTRLARAGSTTRPHRGSLVTRGGLHIHHAVFGVVAIIVAGILEFAFRPGEPWVEMIAVAFGSGAALTLDEFALILHLEDVYWTGEGRKSIDAVILGVTFISLLLMGLLPRNLVEIGDYIVLSRWAAIALLLVNAAFVIVCYVKGKAFMGTIGIFVTPIAVIGALRLAKPGSPWAHNRYTRNPAKLERALRRAEAYHRRWGQWKQAIWDLIGGRPHMSLPTHEAWRETWLGRRGG